MNNDEYTYKEMIREMEKHVAEKAAEDAKKLNKLVLKMNIRIAKPIIYGAPVRIDLGVACDFDRGAWRHKVYHVVFDGRGTSRTLCGQHIYHRNLWVAYLEPGVAYEPPYRKRTCKRCAAHEDYILHQLAVT